MDNNIAASPADFSKAFDFLDSNKKPEPLQDDFALLNAASDVFTKFGIVAKSQVL